MKFAAFVVTLAISVVLSSTRPYPNKDKEDNQEICKCTRALHACYCWPIVYKLRGNCCMIVINSNNALSCNKRAKTVHACMGFFTKQKKGYMEVLMLKFA